MKPTQKMEKPRMEFSNDVLNSWPMTGLAPDEVITELHRLRDSGGSTPTTDVELDDGRQIRIELPHDGDDFVVTEVEKSQATEEEVPQ